MVWTIVSGILIFLGLVGTLLPFLPGAPLALAGLLVYGAATDFVNFSGWAVGIFIGLTLLTILIDVFAPVLGAGHGKKASRHASFGALIGVTFGIFALGPIGIIVGPLLGAFAGEYFGSRDLDQAAKAAMSAFVALLIGTAIKLGIVFAMAGYFVYLLFQ